MSFFLPDPPAKYRPAPFWSWNADLEPEELRRQIRLMHEAGLGGFFMHARSGLQVEYLSEEWMKCVEASLDEAGKLGMDAWLYDENGWPSGFGGGLVNAMGIDYQAKYLRYELLDAADAADKEHTLGFYSADGNTFLGKTLPENIQGEIMRCYFDINPFYVDNLDARVVAEFLRVTHEHYYKHIPGETLKHLRGIFTDEPQLSRNGVVWSSVLEDEYRKAYNCDLIPLLPQMFLEMPQSSQTRIRFWKLCADIFSHTFMEQIRDWCVAHGWELTGHHVLEEWFCYQLSSNGAIMPQYRYYTLPGVDHLTRCSPSSIAATQLVSVAKQYGHKQLLTESFALTGWGCNFTGMRWIYQQQMAFGINYLCQHLQGYSLRGRRKRDYPQSSFYHQPWWDDYKILNDYFSRIGMIIAEGEYSADTLVIHPISSVWKLFTGKYDMLKIAVQTGFETLVSELNSRIVQHHYADEIIVDECGSVSGKEFIIGKCSYKTVIIPQTTNISRKIFTLLRKLHNNGGNVIKIKESVRDGAFTIDGMPMDMDEKEFFDAIPAFDSESAAAEFAAEHATDRIKITEHRLPTSSICGTWRDVEISGHKGRFYYFANANYRSGVDAKIELPPCGKNIAFISQTTGEFFRPADMTNENGRFIVNYQFGAADALAVFISDTIDMNELPVEHRYRKNSVPIRLLPEKSWQISNATDNILTLDYCRFRTDDGPWQYADPIDVQTRLLDLEKECDVEIEFDFTVDEDFDFSSSIDLAVEEPEKFSFSLNGENFPVERNGYLFDKAFQRIRLPQNLKTGTNTIGMKLHFTQSPEIYEMIARARKFESEYNKLVFDTEIESVYLCGSFSVRHTGVTAPLARDASRLKGKFSLGAPLKGDIVNCSELLNHGLPFFAGKVCLKNSFTLTGEEIKNISWLSFIPKGANSVKVKINDSDCGATFWEPFAVPVAGKLQLGINTIELELTISLRNMLGPHHLLNGESYEVSTLSFNRESSLLRNKPPVTTPAFCMVDFGIGELKFSK